MLMRAKGEVMGKSQGRSLDSVSDLDVIVDTDAHVTERVEDLLPYIDEKHDGVKRIIEKAFALRDIYSITHPLPAFPDSEVSNDALYDEGAVTQNPEAKLKGMDEYDIDYGILNPTLNLALPTVNNSQCAVALADAYNSWILDQFTDNEDTLKSTILVPPQRPHEAAEQIERRAAEDDMVGVLIPATGPNPPLGHRMYDPIYEAAEDKDLPIVLHGASSATGFVFPMQRIWSETYAEDHTLVHPFSLMWNLTSMMFNGVPERYPDLKFNFQEAGIGWVSYLKWRLDDHYLALPNETATLNKLPSAYIKEQFYFSTQPLGHTAESPNHLAKAIELAGPGNIMYSSDLPHADFDPPGELFDRINGYFDAAEVEGMMGNIAMELYDLN